MRCGHTLRGNPRGAEGSRGGCASQEELWVSGKSGALWEDLGLGESWGLEEGWQGWGFLGRGGP